MMAGQEPEENSDGEGAAPAYGEDQQRQLRRLAAVIARSATLAGVPRGWTTEKEDESII